jgi:hypothetical protein
MIYLIDDNRQQQQEEYGAFYIHDSAYKGFFKIISVMSDFKSIDWSDAMCILVHKSFPDFDASGKIILGTQNNFEDIIHFCFTQKKPIPLVVFSNGTFHLDYDFEAEPYYIKEINKRIFYSNLIFFLDYYRNYKIIELRNLPYGGNFIIQELTKCFSLLYFDLGDSLNRNFDASIVNMPVLKEFYTKSKSSSSFESFIQQMVLSAPTNKKALEFLDKIIKSYIRYGFNIYN